MSRVARVTAAMPSTAVAAVGKRDAAGSALDDSTEQGRHGIDLVLDIARDGAYGAGAAAPT
jgi:hypothetical protein